MADSNVGTTVEALGGIRPLLEEVKRRITASPANYNQDHYCSTRCCIAGHIDVILNGSEVHESRVGKVGWTKASVQVSNLAEIAIGEPEPWLFSAIWEDHDDLYARYTQAEVLKDVIAMAATGCDAIDLYLKERGL